MKAWERISDWKERELISDLEKEFVRFLLELEENLPEEVIFAAVACIHAQQNGHLCFDLNNTAEWLFEDERSGIELNEIRLNAWKQALVSCSLVSKDGSLQPMVLEDGRLYLHRYWNYEEELASWLRVKSKRSNSIDTVTKEVIQKFVKSGSDLFEIDWQQVALGLSFLKDLVVISGGPGTGKTHTVINILAAHSLVHGEKYRVALAAPTGKAARRLIESVDTGKDNLPKEILEETNLPESAFTVHKLLGSNATGTHFKFNKENKLPYDLVVIDEASMLDITMWVRLIRALDENTKLVVLGDKDQLASVEAGSILGDICNGDNNFSQAISLELQKLLAVSVPSSESEISLNDCVVFLTRSYRFGEHSGIQKLAKAINESDVEAAMEVLKSSKYPDVKWIKPTPGEIEKLIYEYAVDHHTWYSGKSGEEQLSASHNKKILCALRRSNQGVEELNRVAEKLIRRKMNMLNSQEWYPGRIVMATRNNSLLKLRNGEIGIYKVKDAGYIEFENQETNKISTTRLTDYEPAYAITIHKSQGSEYNDIAILLSNEDNPILSKEILYTSVTRARENTLVCASESIIRKAIEKNIWRNSGLKGKIWGHKAKDL